MRIRNKKQSTAFFFMQLCRVVHGGKGYQPSWQLNQSESFEDSDSQLATFLRD